MACLEEIELVRINLINCRKSNIVALHKFVFEDEGDRSNRKRLRKFAGFDYTEEDEKYVQKSNYTSRNLTSTDLIAIYVVLGLNYNKDNLQLYIFQNLQKGNLLKASKSSDGDDGNDMEDDDDDDDESSVGGNEDAKTNVEETDSVVQRKDEDEMSNSHVSAHIANSFKNVNISNRGQHRFTMNFRDIEESVRIFDGSSNFPVERWVEEFEETAVIMEWDDFQKYVFAKKVIKGVALLFIQSERGLTSWEKLQKALKEEFKTVTNSAQLHKNLSENKMKKGENILEYFLKMKEIATRGSIEDAALIQYVIDGINDNSPNKMLLYGTSNVKEFKEKLKCYSVLSEKNILKIDNKNINKKPVYENQHVNKEFTCYNCGGKGHKSINCKNKEKGVKCFNCNTFGHYAKDCNEKKSNTRWINADNEKMMKNANERTH